MQILLRTGFVLAILFLWSGAVVAQEPDTAQAGYEFVSGSIAELSPGRIVVNRAVPGKPPENRSFRLTEETKVEGRLRVGARVTVGFRTSDEGEPIAVRIIVRQDGRRP